MRIVLPGLLTLYKGRRKMEVEVGGEREMEERENL